jgi:CubicO group peptidase (beta-lactamase class C family)
MPRAARRLAAFFLVALLAVARAASPQAPDLTALDAVAQQELQQSGIPGATIAIVSKGRVIYARGFGVANVETGAPMTPDLLFRLGSTTKMFTAAALAALVEKGVVDLQKPVGAYITGLHPSIARLTPHQLLSHTSGLLDEAPMYGSNDEDALLKVVRSWKEDRFFAEPGKIYSYSNPGYWLAGAVVESAGGKLYADQVNDTIFTPLGMSRTTFRPSVAMTYPLAQGHDVDDGKARVVRPFANNAASWPAGSIFSSVEDLSRFVIAFLDNGAIDGKQAIAPGVITRLTTGSTAIPGSESKYGYGLNVGPYRGVTVVQHGGSRSGYGSTIRMVPERKFGVIVLVNRTGGGLPRTVEKAMELVLGLPAPPTPPAPDLPALTPQQAAGYAGVYSQGGTRTMEIVARDGKLFLKQNGRETELRRTGEHRFTSGLVFVAGADGRIEYLHAGGRSWRKT